jgi:hypothetical protein
MPVTRRHFLQVTAVASAVAATAPVWAAGDSTLRLATFEFDVSPPKGHSLCGGWITPVVDYDDPLRALGIVLLGAGQPIVLCAVDWTGILNEAHVEWRQALAEAAGTVSERVAVQCVHQHNAPFACLEAQRIVGQYSELPHIVDVEFFEECLVRGRKAIQAALENARPVTHIGTGRGRVDKVASNRRILNSEGKLEDWRGSSSRNPKHQELPEGLIDPWLRTVAFYQDDRRLAALHYYATHPMSYYGDGRVSSDFVGLARQKRQSEDEGCRHIYFTGCSGNVAAGKYNDGSPEARRLLTERIYDGIRRSEQDLQKSSIDRVGWDVVPIQPPPRLSLDADGLAAQIADGTRRVVDRNRPSYMLAWLRRCQKQLPILLSALHVNQVSLLHLPAESFLEYQLHAEQQAADRFVAVAAYGDGGPWYIPTEEAYPQGGYEVGVAFCDPPVDPMLRGGIDRLLAGNG